MDKTNKVNLIDSVKDRITVQSYRSKLQIDKLRIIDIKQHIGEDGMFEEIMRFKNGYFQEIPDFQIKQISCSRLLPNAIKAWHIHFKQEDVWYVPPQAHMLLGLWDLRKNSPTKNIIMRIALGGGLSRLVYIPRGVAHGVLNLSKNTGTIFYFMNQQFDSRNPDEHRLTWDAAGANFWQPKRE